MSAKRPALTEDELLKRLRVRYTERAGNGDAWAFIPQVRSAAAFDARRTIDAYAMALWPSRGLVLHAFEIKSARSDWLREMKNPAKAEVFCELADFFWLVVGDKEIVKPGELPPTWGLLVPHGAGLRVEVEAPVLRDLTPARARGGRTLPPAFGRSFLAALLRSACAVGNATPQEIAEARQEAHDNARASFEQQASMWKGLHEDLQREVMAFSRESGISISKRWAGDRDAREVGEALRLLLQGDSQIDAQVERLRRLEAEAERIAKFVHERLDALAKPEVAA